MLNQDDLFTRGQFINSPILWAQFRCSGCGSPAFHLYFNDPVKQARDDWSCYNEKCYGSYQQRWGRYFKRNG